MPTSAPTSPPVAAVDAQVPGTLPVTGPPPSGGSAQAVALAPSAQAANAAAADPSGPSDTQSLFFLVTAVFLGLPALLLMTLLATVLTRR